MKSATQISPHKLFDILQKEFLICELRSKIYVIPSDIAFWTKLTNNKRTMIFDLKRKYNLISIFDDESVRKIYEKIIFPEYGLPNFYYPNERLKKNQIYWDIRNYFSIGSKVEFIDTEFIQRQGIVSYCLVDERLVSIKVQNELLFKINFDSVRRITN